MRRYATTAFASVFWDSPIYHAGKCLRGFSNGREAPQALTREALARLDGRLEEEL